MRALIATIVCLATILSAGGEQKIGADPMADATSEARAGHFDAALAALDGAEKKGVSESAVLSLRGVIHLEQGKLDEAVAELRTAHEKDPALAGPRFHLGDALLRQKKWEEARKIYSEMARETNILILSERLRYALLLTYLGPKDDAGAKTALESVVFPTESAAYYYAQAAWALAHDNKSAAEKWIKTADKMFDESKTAWFARPLFDFGWIKNKPPISLD